MDNSTLSQYNESIVHNSFPYLLAMAYELRISKEDKPHFGELRLLRNRRGPEERQATIQMTLHTR